MKKTLFAIVAGLAALASFCSCNSKEDSPEALAPEILSVIPVKGGSGSTVIISGNNFSEKASENTVTFGAAEAVVRAATSTRLTVTAPEAADGEAAVTVTVGGKKAEGFTFTYVTATEPELVISSISPAEGFAGDEVTILGENFSPVKEDMSVLFGDKPATILASAANSVRVTAPENEKGAVEVVVSRGTRTASSLFTYLNLAVLSNEPTVGVEGTEVTITGEGFSETASENTVTVNGQAVEVKSATATKLVVVMPKLAAGTYAITVRSRGHEATGGSYTVEETFDLEVSGNQPENGEAGTVVLISGKGFGEDADAVSVTLGGVVLSVNAVTPTAIAVTIPALANGDYEFTVKVGDKTVTGGKFKYGVVYYVETVAGSGAKEVKDGIGKEAAMAFCQDINLAPDGRIYFTQRNAGFDSVRELVQSNWEVKTLIPLKSEKIDGNACYNASFGADGTFWFAIKDSHKAFANELVGKLEKDGTLSLLELPSHKLKTNMMNVTTDASGNIYVLNRNSGTKESNASYISVYDKNLTLLHDWPVIQFVNYIVWNPTKTKLLFGVVGNASGWGIFEFDPNTGAYEKVVGGNTAAPTAATFADGDAATATIGRIEGMCVGPDGSIYFSDLTCRTIRKVVPGAGGDYRKGTVSTLAGTKFSSGNAEGLATESKLTNPGGVAVLSDGSVLYTEPTLNVIRRIYSK